MTLNAHRAVLPPRFIYLCVCVCVSVVFYFFYTPSLQGVAAKRISPCCRVASYSFLVVVALAVEYVPRSPKSFVDAVGIARRRDATRRGKQSHFPVTIRSGELFLIKI